MSNIPPYQMSTPPGGPPPKTGGTNVWVWILVGLAGMCVVCGVVGAAVLFPVFSQARQAAKKTVSLSTAKQIATSVAIYSSDFDDRMPPIDNGPAVANRLEKYITEDANGSRRGRSRESLKAKAASYSWNTSVSKVVLGDLGNPADLWMFFSTEPPEIKSVSMAYMDGHVRSVARDDLSAQTAVKPIIEKPGK